MRGFIKRKEGLLCAEKRSRHRHTGKKLQVKGWKLICYIFCQRRKHPEKTLPVLFE
jgi:hypothetical protein